MTDDDADQPERDRGHDDQRVEQGSKQGGQHKKDHGQGDDQRLLHALEGVLRLFLLAHEQQAIAFGAGAAEDAVQLARDGAGRGDPGVHIGADPGHALGVAAADLVLPAVDPDIGHITQINRLPRGQDDRQVLEAVRLLAQGARIDHPHRQPLFIPGHLQDLIAQIAAAHRARELVLVQPEASAALIQLILIFQFAGFLVMGDIMHAGHAFHIRADLARLRLQQGQIGAHYAELNIIPGRAGIGFEDTEALDARDLLKLAPYFGDDLIGAPRPRAVGAELQAHERRHPFFDQAAGHGPLQVDHELKHIAAGLAAVKINETDAHVSQQGPALLLGHDLDQAALQALGQSQAVLQAVGIGRLDRDKELADVDVAE